MVDPFLHQLVRALVSMADRACAERCCGNYRTGEYGLQYRPLRCERCPKDDVDVFADMARHRGLLEDAPDE